MIYIYDLNVLKRLILLIDVADSILNWILYFLHLFLPTKKTFLDRKGELNGNEHEDEETDGESACDACCL
jgi:hypothetical protein